jgi:excisionase family DNA binding protein
MYETEVLTLQEAAALLKCHPKTLRLMAMQGKIPARRVGRLWRFSLLKITEWLIAENT